MIHLSQALVALFLLLCVQMRVLFSDHVYHNILYRLASKSVDIFFSVVCLGLGTAAEGSMLDQRVPAYMLQSALLQR